MSHDPHSTAPESNPSSLDSNGLPGGVPPKKKRRIWLWVLGMVLGGGFLGLLVCCGVGAYLVQNYGSAIFETARGELNQTADLREEVGRIESLSMNFFETVEEGKSNPDFMILDGQSESGMFQVSVKMKNSGELEKAFLVMPDGTRKPIDLQRRVDSGTAASRARANDSATPASGDPEASKADPPLDATEEKIRQLENELGLE